MKRLCVFLFSLFFLILPAFNQSAAFVSKLIDTKVVSVGEFAVLMSAFSDTELTVYQAYQGSVASGWLKSDVGQDTPVNYKTVAGYLLRFSAQKGSLPFEISRADRYAFQYFKEIGLYSSNASQYSTLSGLELLDIVSSFYERFSPTTTVEVR